MHTAISTSPTTIINIIKQNGIPLHIIFGHGVGVGVTVGVTVGAIVGVIVGNSVGSGVMLGKTVGSGVMLGKNVGSGVTVGIDAVNSCFSAELNVLEAPKLHFETDAGESVSDE